MKRLLLLPFFLLNGFALLGQNIGVGSNIPHFNSIVAGNTFNITLFESDRSKIVLDVEEPLRNYISVEVKEQTLILSLKSSTPLELKREGREIFISLYTPTISKISLNGNASLRSGIAIDTKTLAVQLSGASSSHIEGRVGEAHYKIGGVAKASILHSCTLLKIEADGAAEILAEGVCSALSLLVSGSSKTILTKGSGERMDLKSSGAAVVNSLKYPVDRVEIMASGLSDIKISALNALSVEVVGGSSIEYIGTPNIGRVEISPLSTFNKIE
ncbi:MAG: DUF2807 domain-containing protein [Bacteroidales bacterium]